jgi:DNA-binding Lrp family transcriptional regulator
VNDRLDALDLSIIAVLEGHGRMSNRQISRELGVSEGTVRSRVRRLQSDGLLRIIAVRNLERAPYATAHLAIFATPGCVKETAEAVAAVPEVVFTAIAVGHCDIVAMCLAEGREALIAVINDRLRTIPGVVRIEATETIGSVKFSPNLRKIR